MRGKAHLKADRRQTGAQLSLCCRVSQKHEDLSRVFPRTHFKNPGVVICSYTPSSRKAETGRPLGSVTKQPTWDFPGLWEILFKGQGWRGREGRTGTWLMTHERHTQEGSNGMWLDAIDMLGRFSSKSEWDSASGPLQKLEPNKEVTHVHENGEARALIHFWWAPEWVTGRPGSNRLTSQERQTRKPAEQTP